MLKKLILITNLLILSYSNFCFAEVVTVVPSSHFQLREYFSTKQETLLPCAAWSFSIGYSDYECHGNPTVTENGWFQVPRGAPPGYKWWLGDFFVVGCSAGKVVNIETGLCEFSPKANGPNFCQSTGQPVNFTTGNKWLAEDDISSVLNLNFARNYNSNLLSNRGKAGSNWVHNFARLLNIEMFNAYVLVTRPDGKEFRFKPISSTWISDADITDKLVELKDGGGTRTGWTYTVDSTSDVENYNATGQLLSITSRAGLTQTMAYSTVSTPPSIASIPDLLISVTDSLGRSLSFTYDTSNRIKTMTSPAGAVYTYSYSKNAGGTPDANNNLVSVTYPDNTVKTYLYENTSFPNALTGVTDENNSRYMTYTYDSNGRAVDEISPTFGTNVNHYGLIYNTDTSGNPTTTVVTDPRGSSRTYNFTTILGVVKSTGQSQPAGSGCAASAAALTYDVNGNIASRTDFKGNKTVYQYDMARNLELSRTEGLASTGGGTSNSITPATRTITTSYHPTWRLPLVVTEYNSGTTNLNDGSGVPTGTALRSTTTVYDTKGNITSITEADPVHSLSRTTTVTYTYSTVVTGLVLSKVVDGPRVDVSDITTYVYYPHDATCVPSSATPLIDPITNTSPANLGCRGQLQSMTNALNQTTTYDRYNHHGQVEQMTDANGLVTTNTYDLRQRLLTRSVTGAGVTTQTTSLTYDGVGQVTQLTMPDASALNYTYDAAHRLTQVQDNLGNKVSYTLDSEGNRLNETTTDPLNVLTKTLSRSYDALNRLQQVTGVQ